MLHALWEGAHSDVDQPKKSPSSSSSSFGACGLFVAAREESQSVGEGNGKERERVEEDKSLLNS